MRTSIALLGFGCIVTSMYNLNQVDEEEIIEVGRKISAAQSATAGDSWVDDDLTMDDYELARILEPIQRDTLGKQLLSDTLRVAGLKDPLELSAIIQPCTITQSGLTSNRRKKWRFPRRLPELASTLQDAKPAEVAAKYQKEIEPLDSAAGATSASLRHYEVQPDWLIYSVVLDATKICIKSGLSTRDASEVLLHELAHYVEMQPRPFSEISPMSFAGEQEYLRAYVDAPGSEVDAYIVQYEFRARTALDAATRKLRDTELFWDPDLRALFPGGRFTGDRAAMAAHIISGGLGRSDGDAKNSLTGAYKISLQHELSIARTRENEAAQIADYRRAEARSYPNLTQQAQDSIARLEAEKTSWSARIQQIRERLAALPVH